MDEALRTHPAVPQSAPDHLGPAQSAPGQASWRERVLVTLALLGLLGLGAGFWLVNGARTFGEVMLGAFSLCF